jgi:CspA family cold shock protein
MQTGTVKWFNAAKGYGFITPSDGSADVFVHYTAIDGKGFRDLKDGDRVQFDSMRTAKGLQASKVTVIRG